MRVHFIAIGGSVMHNLAIALRNQGHTVTGSDDEIFDPALSRLREAGLLPAQTGWDATRIHPELDAILLGMHARADNPELLKARELGLRIYSFPEFIYEQTRHKKRVVIGGSHGKTTITSMIMHVLQHAGLPFDYMVGAAVEGFPLQIRLSETAPIAILEGDEYPDSAIHKTPKFHLYKPDIGLLSGIAWDHVNVFPTFNGYVDQFRQFMAMIPPNGKLFFAESDPELQQLTREFGDPARFLPYRALPAVVRHGQTFLLYQNQEIAVPVFGEHNRTNLGGALLVLKELGVTEAQFYAAIPGFKGAARRLELLAEKPDAAIYRDFAHSPSKLKATIHAVKEQYPGRHLLSVMELHTFSSLSSNFLSEYKDSMKEADEAVVFYNPHALALKKLPALDPEQVRRDFNDPQLRILHTAPELWEYLAARNYRNSNLLLMSSGHFDGADLNLIKTLL